MGKRHRRDIGVIADLRDQAEWSSYAQDVPRLGNVRREGIRLARYRRFFRGTLRVSLLWWLVPISLVVAAFGVFLLVELLARTP